MTVVASRSAVAGRTIGRARVWVPGRSEINMRESCNGLPSVVLSFITSSHGVEFVIFVLLKRRIEGE